MTQDPSDEKTFTEIAADGWENSEGWKRWERIKALGDRVVPSLGEMQKESDRGCVIIVASLFDDLLGACLKEKFISLSGTGTIRDQNLLLWDGQNPPMLNFGVRTRACLVLGVIDEATRKSLDAIRLLRRSCAHKWSHFTFTDDNLSPLLHAIGSKARESVIKQADAWVTEDRSPERIRRTKFLCASFDVFTRLPIPDVEHLP